MSGHGIGIGVGLNSQGHNVLGAASTFFPETYGTLRLWLDDGNYTTDTGKMNSMTNQAAGGVSGLWTTPTDYTLISDVNGSGRTGFQRDTTGQVLTANTAENSWAGGVTMASVIKVPLAILQNGYLIRRNLSSNIESGGAEVFSTADGVLKLSNPGFGSFNATLNVIPDNAWCVMVVVQDETRTKVFINGSDVTNGTPDTWNGSNAWEFSYALGGNTDSNYAKAGLYGYIDGFTNAQVNTLGQAVSDEFGFSHTWALA